MNEGKRSKSTATGFGVIGLLTIIFAAMKLTGVIGWSWWLVLIPLWSPIAFAVAALFIALVMILVRETMAAYKKQTKAGHGKEGRP